MNALEMEIVNSEMKSMKYRPEGSNHGGVIILGAEADDDVTVSKISFYIFFIDDVCCFTEMFISPPPPPPPHQGPPGKTGKEGKRGEKGSVVSPARNLTVVFSHYLVISSDQCTDHEGYCQFVLIITFS